MTSLQWEEVKELFHEALEHPAETRDSFLLRECADDIVRSEVTRLLIENSRAGIFLNEPAEADPDRLLHSGQEIACDEPDLVSSGLFVGRTVGAYRLIQEIGRGGMGTVWLGERADGMLRRRVAIKLPHPGIYGLRFAERFHREREILASLAHPHIGRLYDAGVTDEGQPFLALEYIEGTDLIVYCDSRQLRIRDRLILFVQVLSAVHYANSHLVIHRDLKPSNILVTQDGQAKLLDFGVAKLILDGASHATELTRMGGQALTPSYASPEQLLAEPISTASDVYSLGVVLFELLTGERPYRNTLDSRVSLEEAILAGDIARPSRAVQNVANCLARGATDRKLSAILRGDLDNILLKALARQPEQRYATADAFSQDIQRYLERQPILAKAASAPYRWKKFVRRNRLAVGALAAVIIALAAGLTAALWEAGKARQQAHVAESVLAFMEGIFRANSLSQPDPVKARQTTARELLDMGAKHLDSSLSDVPAAKLRVVTTLNEMYNELDLWDKEVEFGRKRVALTRSLHGRYDPAVADALLDLAESTANQDLHEEHGQILREIGTILDKNKDYTSQRRANFEETAADYYNDVDFLQALSHTRNAVRLTRTLPTSFDRSNDMQSSAYYELEAGEFAAAEAVSAEAIAIAKAVPGHAEILGWIYKHLADAQSAAEDLSSAERNYATATEYTRKYNTARGPWALGVALAKANFLANTSRIGQALAMAGPAFDTALELARQHIALIILPDATIEYGSALMAYGDIEGGLDVWKQAENVGAHLEAWNALRIHLSRAAPLIEMGRYTEAEGLLAGDAREWRRLNRQRTVSWNSNLLLRARLLNVSGRSGEALKVLSDYRAFPIPAGRVSRERLDESILRSEIQLSAQDFRSARQLAAQAREEITGSPNRPYLATWEARAALAEGRSLELSGEPRTALALLERAVALRTNLLDPVSPALADAKVALSNCYLDLGKRKKALSQLAEARAIYKKHLMLGEHYRKPMAELENRFRRRPHGS